MSLERLSIVVKMAMSWRVSSRIWGLATARAFAILDGQLAAAGSPERVYAVNGGNDLCAFFLTPELFQIITADPDADASGGPYKPTEEYPWFGQPHDS